MKNTRPAKPRHSSYSDIFVSMIKFPFRHPLLFFFILLILLSGSLVFLNRRNTIAETKSKSRVKNSHAIILDHIKERCQTPPFSTANKVPGIRLDVINGEFYPSLCAEERKKRIDFSETCKSLISQRKQFMSNRQLLLVKEQILKIREAVNRQATSEIYQTEKVYAEISQTLSQSQQEIFEDHYNRITFLRKAQLTSESAKGNKMGACGEHVFSSIYDILNIGQKRSTIIQLKYITVKNNDGQAHDFIVITSEENSDKVRTSLKNMRGYICDSWNEGYFQDTTLNTNQLYQEGWDTIMVDNISLDFDYQDLPLNAKQFLDNQLKKIGFMNLHGKPHFSSKLN